MTTSPTDRLTPAQRAELAVRLSGRRGAAQPGPQTPPADPATADPASGHPTAGHPLSLTQYRMWLAEQSAPEGSAAYTVPVALRLTGPLDSDRLRTCLDLLAERHLALRTRFVQEAGVPRQLFDLPTRVPLEIRHLPDGEGRLDQALAEEAGRSFPLDGPPYVRAVLLAVAPHEHVLVLALHHSVCDGWSLEILIRDLLAGYGAPGAPEVPAPAAQHLDYALWEHSPEGRAELALHAGHWARQHEHLAEAPPLPFTREGGRGGEAAGEQALPTAAVQMPAHVVTDVREFARSQGATTHAVWLAAFAATWHLTTGARSVPVGVPAANRISDRYDRAVGAFVSTMPLVLRIHPGSTFAELVGQATEALLTGATRPVAPLAAEGSPVTAPAAVFVLNGEDTRPRECGPLTVELLPIRVEGSQGELTVQLVERDSGVSCMLAGSPERYAAGGLARMSRAIRRCLEVVLAAPDTVLASVDPRDPQEAALVAAMSSAPPAPSLGLPYEAFSHWVERTPEAFAVRDSATGDLSYRQLAERTARFASALHMAGVRPGMPVAIHVAPSADYLALALAAWRLGGWIVPLRTEDPAARVHDLLRVCGARFLVHGGDFDTAALPQITGIPLADIAATRGTPAPAAARPGPDDLAYAVFTSGTTGTPKCVAVSQGALANELAWRRAEIGLAAPDRVLQTIPLAFDPSFWQCFGPLATGAGVVFPGADLGARPASLVDAAVEHSATVIDLVPSLLAALTDADLERLPARVVFCGGEVLPTAQAERYLKVGRGALYNQYGPSEACIDATSHRCLPGVLGDGAVPVGRPIGGVRLHVLDSALRPVPVGCTGELYVGGPGVARGYVGSPQATAAAFLPEPNGPDGARMYRTGDRVRWNEDGTLQFLGRADNQVKVRGHRVELEEVDRCLAAALGVREAAAVVVGERVSRLVGFVTGDPGLDPGEVRAHLARTLPAHMVPGEVRVLPALPVTANGKADRRELAGLALRRPSAEADEGPLDPVAAAVLEAFATELDLPSAIPSDHLYELGGASLGAARIAARLSVRLGTEVPVRTVLAHPRAGDLAQEVRRIRGLAPATEAPYTEGADAELTPEQLQVLRQERVLGHPTPPIPLLLALEQPVGREDVERAVRLLADRHEALGPLTGADTRTGETWQPCLTAAIPAEPALAYWRPELAERTLPDGLPGIQVTLLTGPDGAARHLLLHLARNRGDGASVGILAAELLLLLAGGPLPGPAPRYQDYARARRAHLEARRDELEGYWAGSLRTAPEDPFADRRPAARREFRNHGARLSIQASGYARITAECREWGVTPTAVFLAALGRLLARTEGTASTVVGVPVGHRSAASDAGLVGRAVDMLPVRVTAADPAADRAAGPTQAHEALLTALDHGDLPLLRIAELTGAADPAVRPPVCAVGLIVHEAEENTAVVPDTLSADFVPEHWSDLDLVLHVQPRPDGSCLLLLSGSRQLFGPTELHKRLTLLDAELGGEQA